MAKPLYDSIDDARQGIIRRPSGAPLEPGQIAKTDFVKGELTKLTEQDIERSRARLQRLFEENYDPATKKLK